VAFAGNAFAILGRGDVVNPGIPPRPGPAGG